MVPESAQARVELHNPDKKICTPGPVLQKLVLAMPNQPKEATYTEKCLCYDPNGCIDAWNNGVCLICHGGISPISKKHKSNNKPHKDNVAMINQCKVSLECLKQFSPGKVEDAYNYPLDLHRLMLPNWYSGQVVFFPITEDMAPYELLQTYRSLLEGQIEPKPADAFHRLPKYERQCV